MKSKQLNYYKKSKTWKQFRAHPDFKWAVGLGLLGVVQLICLCAGVVLLQIDVIAHGTGTLFASPFLRFSQIVFIWFALGLIMPLVWIGGDRRGMSASRWIGFCENWSKNAMFGPFSFVPL